MSIITRHNHPKLTHIKKLNSSKKYRSIHKQCVFENSHWIWDALIHHPEFIDYLVLSPEQKELREAAHCYGIHLILCNQKQCNTIAHVKHAAGCFAVMHQPSWAAENRDPEYVIGVCNITIPANMGAILRNAHAFGCDTLYLIGPCCDPFHPESIRAAAGHIFDVPIVPLEFSEAQKRIRNYQGVLLDSNATTSLSNIEWAPPIWILLGSETGINHEFNPSIQRYYIPMESHVDSLNVAATSAIALHALYNIRHQ